MKGHDEGEHHILLEAVRIVCVEQVRAVAELEADGEAQIFGEVGHELRLVVLQVLLHSFEHGVHLCAVSHEAQGTLIHVHQTLVYALDLAGSGYEKCASHVSTVVLVSGAQAADDEV